MDDIKLSEASANYVMAFAELSKRLIEIAVAVDTLKLHYGAFGSWELVARKRDKAVRFLFDGRDRCIETEVSPIQKNGAPNQWEKVESKAIPGSYSEAIAYAEGVLKERFGKISN